MTLCFIIQRSVRIQTSPNPSDESEFNQTFKCFSSQESRSSIYIYCNTDAQAVRETCGSGLCGSGREVVVIVINNSQLNVLTYRLSSSTISTGVASVFCSSNSKGQSHSVAVMVTYPRFSKFDLPQASNWTLLEEEIRPVRFIFLH